MRPSMRRWRTPMMILKRWRNLLPYGAEPSGLPDVALLVPDAVQDRRANEFNGLPFTD